MDLENNVDSFVDDFLQNNSNVDEELLDYRNHGWVCDIKNFNTIFEEMAKVSNDLGLKKHLLSKKKSSRGRSMIAKHARGPRFESGWVPKLFLLIFDIFNIF